jgi:hypothetical protein
MLEYSFRVIWLTNADDMPATRIMRQKHFDFTMVADSHFALDALQIHECILTPFWHLIILGNATDLSSQMKVCRVDF